MLFSFSVGMSWNWCHSNFALSFYWSKSILVPLNFFGHSGDLWSYKMSLLVFCYWVWWGFVCLVLLACSCAEMLGVRNKKCVNKKYILPTKKKRGMVFCYQNCSSDWEKLLELEAEGLEFAKYLRSLEQFIQTVKGQNNFW